MKEIDVEAKELQLLFEVVDTGTGFDSEGEAVMFKPFSQVDSSVSSKSAHNFASYFLHVNYAEYEKAWWKRPWLGYQSAIDRIAWRRNEMQKS